MLVVFTQLDARNHFTKLNLPFCSEDRIGSVQLRKRHFLLQLRLLNVVVANDVFAHENGAGAHTQLLSRLMQLRQVVFDLSKLA